MSNIMHKVKDAVTGHHDKQTARGFRASDNVDDTRDTSGSSNPRTTGPSSGMGSDTYGSGPGSGYQTGTRPDFQRDENRSTGGPTNAGPHDSGLANKMDPRVDSDRDNRGYNTGNAGPHDSGLANKMDPRVDSDLDNRGYNAGNTGFQDTGDSSYGSNPSNMASTRQPLGANNKTSEESYSTSSREHQSHATTSQTTSGQMDPNAMSGLDSGTGQQGFGGFGGGAAGGSSNDNNFGTRGQSGLQDSDPLNKLDPRVRGSNEQQNTMGNQRGGY